MAQGHLLDGVLAHGAGWAGLVATLAAGGLGRGPTRRGLLGVGGALLAAGVGLSVVQGSLAFAESLAPRDVADVLSGTRYGRTVVAFGLVAGLAWTATATSRTRAAATAGLGAAFALVALGHGSSRGTASPLALVHLVHTVSVCLWMGGLVAISARVADGQRPREDLAAFSARAGPLVAVVLLSGVLLVGRYGAPVPSPYTAALGLKLALVAALLGLALGNRRRLARLDAPGAWTDLDRGLLVELAVAASVGAVASLLSQLEPP